MSSQKKKPPLAVVLLCVVIVLLVIVVAMLAALLLRQEADRTPQTTRPEQTTQGILETEPTTEHQETNVPVITDYIVLSYPVQIHDQITVTTEPVEGGQQILFTTDLTGQTLELFRFTISPSEVEQQHKLGVLKDEKGDMAVSVAVADHSSGSLPPEQYNQIMALQEWVNDIILQFHEDPRFVPER